MKTLIILAIMLGMTGCADDDMLNTPRTPEQAAAFGKQLFEEWERDNDTFERYRSDCDMIDDFRGNGCKVSWRNGTTHLDYKTRYDRTREEAIEEIDYQIESYCRSMEHGVTTGMWHARVDKDEWQNGTCGWGITDYLSRPRN